MTCENAISEYFDLDRGETPKGDLADHIRRCPSCSRLVLMLDRGMESLTEPTLRPGTGISSELFVQSVMAKVREESTLMSEESGEDDSPMTRWIVVGVIILAAIPLSSFSESLSWLSQLFGSRLDFPLHLVLGLAFTIYALFFIGSHLKGFARRLHLKPAANPSGQLR